MPLPFVHATARGHHRGPILWMSRTAAFGILLTVAASPPTAFRSRGEREGLDRKGIAEFSLLER